MHKLIQEVVGITTTDQNDNSEDFTMDYLELGAGTGKFTKCIIQQLSKNVFAATCFHWFATPEAVQEIHRILVPNGNLVLVWNDVDMDKDLISQLEATYFNERAKKPLNIYRSDNWRTVFYNNKLFKEVVDKHFDGPEIKGSVDFILKFYSSISFIANASKERQEEIFKDMRNIISSHPETKRRSVISIPMVSRLVHFKKV